MAIEAISSFNVLERLRYLLENTDIFLMNYIILLIITCPCLLFPKMTFIFNLFAVGVFSIAYGSRILMVIRGMPLRWPDFFIAKEGLSIASKYLSIDMIFFISILMVIALYFLTKSYSFHLNLSRPKLTVSFMILVTSLNLAVMSYAHKYEVVEIEESLDYGEEGVIYSFVSSYEASGMEVPENYNENTLKLLKDNLMHYRMGTVTSQNPNIIFLQIESFVDPLTLKGITYSKDPIVNMRKVMTGHWSGTIEVPGINTARTEFEIVTGVPISRLFKYEVPYTSKELDGRAIESAAQLLKKYKNYHATALHNHEGSFYQRDIIYGSFGFDHFIPIEYMEGLQYSKNWPKDKILLKYIKEALENTSNRDFIFAVTVGTHSSYDYDYEENTSGIEIGGEIEEPIRRQIQDYIDRLYETDQFIGELIKYVKELEEPTILVGYSDHIPALDIITYDKEYIKDQVPYFMISNYGLKGQLEEVIPAYRLYTQVFNLAGLPRGILSAAHQAYKKDKTYNEKLDLISYDLLIGERYLTGGKDAYPVSELQLGVP